MLYLSFLEVLEPDRQLWIALSDATYKNVFQRKSIQLLIQRNKVPLLVIQLDEQEIIAWIK